MANNPTSFRYPLPEDPKQAAKMLFNGLKDLNDAIVKLSGNTNAQAQKLTQIINQITGAGGGGGGGGFPLGVFPLTISKLLHQWLDSYDATTGQFTQSQPSSLDLSDWATAINIHDEPLDDGNSNFIFANGDIVVVTGVPNETGMYF